MFAGSLGAALIDAGGRFADRQALWAAGETYTYRELLEEAGQYAAVLRANGIAPGDRVGILSHRTLTAHAAIIGALLAGCIYVPMNPGFKAERNGVILRFSGARALIVDGPCAAKLDQYVDRLPEDLLIISADPETLGSLPHGAVAKDSQARPSLETLRAEEVDAHDDAYILFTSGTTGTPKGVPLSHANVAAYLKTVMQFAPHGPDDRLLQLVDLTFDLSIHDMFLTWLNGAALFSLPEKMGPLTPRFIARHELTSCFIVPSAAARGIEQGLVKPGKMPSLRVTFIAGEALPTPIADGWLAAAPNSTLFNLYGPTEGTTSLTWFHHRRDHANDYDMVPIGHPFEGTRIALFDQNLQPVSGAEDPAELFYIGDQMTKGYWNSPELNAAKFVEVDGQRWYRSGDFCRMHPQYGLLYVGRADRQVKVRGLLVELQQIEAVLRRVTGRSQLAVLAWPLVAEGTAQGTVAFIPGEGVDVEQVRAGCRAIVEEHMVPDRIIALDELPLNANGKVDYMALAKRPELA